MLTRTQTQHQILNHLLGCRIEHPLTDDNVERATNDIMDARNNDQPITTRFICQTAERISQAEQYLQYLESLDTTNETR